MRIAHATRHQVERPVRVTPGANPRAATKRTCSASGPEPARDLRLPEAARYRARAAATMRRAVVGPASRIISTSGSAKRSTLDATNAARSRDREARKTGEQMLVHADKPQRTERWSFGVRLAAQRPQHTSAQPRGGTLRVAQLVDALRPRGERLCARRRRTTAIPERDKQREAIQARGVYVAERRAQKVIVRRGWHRFLEVVRPGADCWAGV